MRRFINHGVSDLGVVGDITLDEYLKIGRNALDQAVAQNVTIDLNDHTLQRSGLSSPESNGHVIEVFGVGTLTLKNGTLAGGYANNGGGICNFGAVTLNNVTISECKARDGGGGIMNYGDATLTITGGAFNNCLSTAGGGAIVNHSTANISGCTFDSNTAYTRGGAIWNDATLTVSNCTFTGNQAPVSGVEGDGGTFHLDGGTANLSDVTITNSHSTNGGAIYVSDGATLTVDGGRIEKNTSDESGGAIADYGTLNMKGSLIVKNNTPDDVYLAKGKKINVINALTGGENSIDINMEKPGVFTDGYSTYYTTVPVYPFFAYGINSTAMLASGDHAYECAWVYGYMECSWDEATQTVTHTRRLLTESYQNLCSSTFASGGNLQPGWYIVEGTANIGSNSFTCVPDGSGTVHIILCDDASITANGLYLNTTDLDYNYERKELHIYSQSYGDKMGKLKVVNTHDRLSAAIGAAKKAENAGYATGDIYIHGGDISWRSQCFRPY